MTVLPCPVGGPPAAATSPRAGRGGHRPDGGGADFADLLGQAAASTDPVPVDLPADPSVPPAGAVPPVPVPPVPVPPVPVPAVAVAPVLAAPLPVAGGPAAPVPVAPVPAAPVPAASVPVHPGPADPVPVAGAPVTPAPDRPAAAPPAGPGAEPQPPAAPTGVPVPGPPQLREGGPRHHGRVPVAQRVPGAPPATLAGGLIKVPVAVPAGTPVPGGAAAPVVHRAEPTLPLPTATPPAGGADADGPGEPLPTGQEPVLRAPGHLHPTADTQADVRTGPAVGAPHPGRAAPPEPAPAATPAPAPPPAAPPAAPPAPAAVRSAPTDPTPLAPALGALAREALRTGGPTRVVLRLDPPELGSVQVTLAVRARGVHVQLVADDQAAAGALSARRPEVRTALEALGLDLSGWDVAGGDLSGTGQGRQDDRTAAQTGGEDTRHPGREPRTPYRREQARARAEALAYAERHTSPRTSSGVFL